MDANVVVTRPSALEARMSAVIPCSRTRYDQAAELFFSSVYIAVYRAIKRETRAVRFHEEVERKERVRKEEEFHW